MVPRARQKLMGKYAHLTGGVASIALGVWLIRATWPLCWKAILAIAPLLLVVGGVLAVLIGLAEITDHLSQSRQGPPPQ